MTIHAKERAPEKLEFLRCSYAEATNVVLVRANATIRSRPPRISPAKKVGAQISSAGDKVAKRVPGSAQGERARPGYSDYKLYDHYPGGVRRSDQRPDRRGREFSSTLAIAMKEQPGKYKTVGGIQNLKAFFGMAFRKEDADFLKFANEQFAR